MYEEIQVWHLSKMFLVYCFNSPRLRMNFYKNLILNKFNKSYAKDYVMIDKPMSAAAKYKVTWCIYHFFLVGCKNGDA